MFPLWLRRTRPTSPRVDPALAAKVIPALPFDFGVRVLEHPEFEQRPEVFRHFYFGVAYLILRGTLR